MKQKIAKVENKESPLWKQVTGKSKLELQLQAAKDFKQYMINSHFNPNDLVRELNASTTSGMVSEEQRNSFFYKAERHLRDFNQFTMNTAYNFYREGVIGSYFKKIGDQAP